jgi:leucyl-tRNA synthetase
MILRNELKRAQAESSAGSAVWDEAVRTFLLLAAPVFPHVAEELWTEVLGLPYSIHQQAWPTYDEAVLVRSQVTLVVQVNGKVRDQVVLDADVARDEARVRELVLELPRIQSHIATGTVQRIIVVPGKLANIVVR